MGRLRFDLTVGFITIPRCEMQESEMWSIATKGIASKAIRGKMGCVTEITPARSPPSGMCAFLRTLLLGLVLQRCGCITMTPSPSKSVEDFGPFFTPSSFCARAAFCADKPVFCARPHLQVFWASGLAMLRCVQTSRGCLAPHTRTRTWSSTIFSPRKLQTVSSGASPCPTGRYWTGRSRCCGFPRSNVCCPSWTRLNPGPFSTSTACLCQLIPLGISLGFSGLWASC